MFALIKADSILVGVAFSLGWKSTSETPDLSKQGFAERAQGEVRVGRQEREIEVFRVAIQAVESSQRSTAIESGSLEEFAPPEPQQRKLLQNLPQRIDIVIARLAVIPIQHAANRVMHFRPPGVS